MLNTSTQEIIHTIPFSATFCGVAITLLNTLTSRFHSYLRVVGQTHHGKPWRLNICTAFLFLKLKVAEIVWELCHISLKQYFLQNKNKICLTYLRYMDVIESREATKRVLEERTRRRKSEHIYTAFWKWFLDTAPYKVLFWWILLVHFTLEPRI